MSPRGSLLRVDYGDRFQERFLALDATGRAACARVIEALVKQTPTHGMRIKPILPHKVYHEARISSGDRLIFRVESRILYVIDVVHHDDIDRYGRWPPRAK